MKKQIKPTSEGQPWGNVTITAYFPTNTNDEGFRAVQRVVTRKDYQAALSKQTFVDVSELDYQVWVQAVVDQLASTSNAEEIVPDRRYEIAQPTLIEVVISEEGSNEPSQIILP